MSIEILTLPLGMLGANGYLVARGGGPQAVMIDPGGDADRVLQALRQRGWTLTHILLTHAHFDHIGGAADLAAATGAVLALHPADLPLLHHGGGAREFGLPVSPCPEPGLRLEAGQTLEAAGLSFRVLFVPGHTPGHVAFYLPEAGAVFSGDVLFRESIGRTDLPGGSYPTLMRSLREVLLVLPGETVVHSGHGPATTLAAEKRDNPFLAE